MCFHCLSILDRAFPCGPAALQGQPAFTSTLGELSLAIKTPWLLYVPFFCGEEDGGNVYEKDGWKFVQGVRDSAQFAE
eukprot:SAG22_NODE_13423_length_407_cov_1.000000_2_plen_77_part_01